MDIFKELCYNINNSLTHDKLARSANENVKMESNACFKDLEALYYGFGIEMLEDSYNNCRELLKSLLSTVGKGKQNK